MNPDGSEAARYSDGAVSGTNLIGDALDAATAFEAIADVAGTLSIESPPQEIAGAVLDRLFALLPYRALGVCIVPSEGGEPLVALRMPPSTPEPGRAPTRLFPEFDDEHVIDLDGPSGSTLHVASLHGPLDGTSVEHTVLLCAGRVLSNGLRGAEAFRRIRPESREVAELRAQLIQAEKLASFGQIVAGVVHELANPVTSIVACTDYLKRKAEKDAGLLADVEHIERIGRAADRILKFSRDLVAYARPASEEPGPVVLPEIISQAHAFCEHELSRNAVAFTAEYEDGAGTIIGQSGPLIQVFVNLFTNAAHSMSDHGGRLSVRTTASEDGTRISVHVTDTGTGIPRENLSRLFEPFFTTKEKGRGTGLGLSIVREIVHAHGGAVDATSTLGEGTTFTLSLPAFESARR